MASNNDSTNIESLRELARLLAPVCGMAECFATECFAINIENLREFERLLAPACSMTQSLATQWEKQNLSDFIHDLGIDSDDESEPRETQQFKDQADLMSHLSQSLQFVTTLSKLMRNDSETRVVNGRKSFPLGHGRSLGKALRHNTIVEELCLDLDSFFADKSRAGDENEMKHLLEFFATSTTLVHFGASGESISDRTICSSLLDGISQCQQLRQLEWEVHVAPLAFQRIMTKLQFLQELNVTFDFSGGRTYYRYKVYPPDELEAIAKAFQSNHTLQTLKLAVKGDKDTFTAILAALHEHPTLRELHCWAHGRGVRVAAISDYLGCPTCKLERLTISCFDWTRSDMARLLSGLQRAPVAIGGLPTTLLHSLRLEHGSFEEEAIEVLSEFLETPTENQEEQTVYDSSLIALSLVGHDLGEDSSRRLADSLFTATVVAAEAATDSHDVHDPVIDTSRLIPTIGSHIQTLCLDLKRGNEGFLRHLAANADRVHLQTLELQNLDRAVGMSCYTCLPKLSSLKKLRLLQLPRSQRDLYWIVRGLKDNVSILEVETSENDGQQFSAAQRRLIDAYGQRNLHWNALIGTSSGAVANNDTVGTETGTGTTGVTAASTTGTQGAAADLCLGSSLLQCVQQLPPTRTTMLSRGLLALGQRIDVEASNGDEPRSLA